jgi:hypothetical protein
MKADSAIMLLSSLRFRSIHSLSKWEFQWDNSLVVDPKVENKNTKNMKLSITLSQL